MVSHLNNPDATATDGPLSGVVIADFTRVLAGPYCTMLLADMGATVIKVEGPSGDDSRQWVPPARDGVSTYYLSVNRNKNSIMLDMKNPDDLETAYSIIDQADVFIENFKPGGLAQFGLDEQSVAQRWPGIVHASITGFGTAEGAHMPGYDLIAQAVSGMMTVTGSQDGPPQRAGVAIFDVVMGLQATVGVLGALHERAQSGKGQHLEIDLLSASLSGLVNQTTGYVACGNVPTRMGNDHPSLFPYGPFKAADRDIIICCGNDAQFSRMITRLELPDLASDTRFDNVKNRNANREPLRALMEEALAAKSADEWFELLQLDGVPASPVLGIDEGVDFAQKLGLNPVIQAGQGAEAVPLIKHPVTFSRTPARYDKAPPTLDQDRADVLQWLSQAKSLAQGKESHDLAGIAANAAR
ncbi:CaiB/BaiF CoA transferase family protein [Glutamicibacter sp. Je.9.36]|uniref:CaiB/BaiF CoA transferase family protein n=1 Tax=Glutamicibacter sp. Je.9.36 TaxID=3142837 RepID=UPI003DA9E5D9